MCLIHIIYDFSGMNITITILIVRQLNIKQQYLFSLYSFNKNNIKNNDVFKGVWWKHLRMIYPLTVHQDQIVMNGEIKTVLRSLGILCVISTAGNKIYFFAYYKDKTYYDASKSGLFGKTPLSVNWYFCLILFSQQKPYIDVLSCRYVERYI